MIKSNLKVKLAENNIRITKLSNDTGISRSTLTALSEGYSKGIQFDTLNTICRYLKIDPSDLFIYVPIDITPNLSELNFENCEINYLNGNYNQPYLEHAEISAVLFLNIKTETKDFSVEFTGKGTLNDNNISILFSGNDNIDDILTLNKLYDDLPRELQIQVLQSIKETILPTIKNNDFYVDDVGKINELIIDKVIIDVDIDILPF